MVQFLDSDAQKWTRVVRSVPELTKAFAEAKDPRVFAALTLTVADGLANENSFNSKYLPHVKVTSFRDGIKQVLQNRAAAAVAAAEEKKASR